MPWSSRPTTRSASVPVCAHWGRALPGGSDACFLSAAGTRRAGARALEFARLHESECDAGDPLATTTFRPASPTAEKVALPDGSGPWRDNAARNCSRGSAAHLIDADRSDACGSINRPAVRPSPAELIMVRRREGIMLVMAKGSAPREAVDAVRPFRRPSSSNCAKRARTRVPSSPNCSVSGGSWVYRRSVAPVARGVGRLDRARKR